MTVNLSGTFKRDELDLNGLESIVDQLIEKRYENVLCAVLIRPKRIVDECDEGGAKRVVTKVVHIEPLTGDAAEAAKKYLDEAYRARTGRTESAEADSTLMDGLKE